MCNIYINSKILLLWSILMSVVGLTSCIKNDNYTGPGETITGTIYDSLTGKPLQVEQSVVRIELLELSWTETLPTTYPYFYTNINGYYFNSKIFKGFYNINVNGPFVPLNHKLWPQPNRDTINVSVNRQIEGVVTQDYTVSSILEVDWVTDPVFNTSDSTISATVIITRGTKNRLFQSPVTDVNFYLCQVPYPGNGNYDNRYSAFNTAPTLNTNRFVLGQPYTIKSIGKATRRTWWVRVGSATSVSLPTGKQFNFSTVKAVTVK